MGDGLYWFTVISGIYLQFVGSKTHNKWIDISNCFHTQKIRKQSEGER